MLDRLLRPKEVAEILGVDRNYVYTILTRGGGTLRSVKINGLRRVRASVLDAWIDSHTTA